MNARTMLVMSVAGSVLLAFVVHAAAQQPELSAQHGLYLGDRVDARQSTLPTAAVGRVLADVVVSATEHREPLDPPGAALPQVFDMLRNVLLDIEGTLAYVLALLYDLELHT